ncbi:MAG: hypothetical protein E7546_06000 [Ruminococcaceae bacterium]|nr:hypothetical protein [Oscillospiraceae bacterium]
MDNYYSENAMISESGAAVPDNGAVYSENLPTEPEQQEIKVRTYAHPSLVLLLMLVFFPAGLIAMLFFTKWGAFAKILVTLFVLAVALSVYEVLVLYNVIDLPSLIGMIVQLWNDYINF